MKFGKACVAPLLASMLCSSALANPPITVITPMTLVRHAFAANDCALALPQARGLRSDAHPPTGDDWAWLNSIIVACDEKAGDKATAYKDALAATTSDPSSTYVWRMRLRYEFGEKRWREALATIDAMAAKKPAALNSIPIRAYFSLHQQFETSDDEQSDVHLLRLLNDTYKPDEPFADMETLRLAYARRLYDAGDKAGAGAIVNAIQTFAGLVEVGLDPDFRALQDPKVDLHLAAERQYTEDGITASQHPESLDGVIQVATDLRHLGRYQDALNTLESVHARIGDPKAFVDAGLQTSRWWEWRAQLYAMLGDYDHVAESYRGAIAVNQNGQPNIDQILDFAIEQEHFGRYEEALTTLTHIPSDAKNVNPFGEMVFHYAHACAASLAGHRQDAGPDLIYVAVHEKDAPLNAAITFLCAGDMDKAAAVVIRTLAIPKHRAGMLEALSDFLPDPPNVPAMPFMKGLKEMKARTDVRAAIAKAGGTASFSFRQGDI